MIIIVTGSVASGKTTIAKAISKRLKIKYFDVNKIIKSKMLMEKYIKKLDSYEVDVDRLNNFLIGIIKKSENLVLDSHLSHYLPRKYVDYCIVCKCNLKILKTRLRTRKYNDTKIRENLDSEIFDVCLVEALENKHKVIVVDTSKNSVDYCIKKILESLPAKSPLPS